MERVTLDDTRVIARQIRRTPRGLRGVARRCAYGYPQVVLVCPMVDRVPFPTIYWLTCPFLRSRIDLLEADGWIGRLESHLASDESFAERQEEAHRMYIRDRLALLTERDRRTMENRRMLPSLSERGIGGIADRRRIKCLHLHVAHSLARGTNPTGKIVLEALERQQCPPEEVICSAPEGRSRSI